MESIDSLRLVAARFDALANPARVRILQLLLAAHPAGGMTAGNIQAEILMPGSTLSHHLDRLGRAGLIRSRKDGRWIWYSADAEGLRATLDFLFQECCTRHKVVPVEALEKKENTMKTEAEIHESVRQAYSQIAEGKRSCCTDLTQLRDDGGGYTAEEIASLPDGAALGLGCGAPGRLAPLEEGMTVLDLGSGAGVDVFLAAQKVGPQGRVIGVDMTGGMIEKARANAAAGGYANVEFRLGQIEKMPVESGSVDVILSNCVINLAPDKGKVFSEAHRVLKPGGRMQISDVVTRGTAPEELRGDVEKWTGCIAGAMDREQYLETIRQAGFRRVTVEQEWAYDACRTETFAALSISVVAEK